MVRLAFVAFGVLALGVFVPRISAEPPSTPGVDTGTDTGTNGVSTLKETLEKGLKTRRPEEFAFVHKVVQMVNDGHLPMQMVQETFLWARKKPEHSFQYFRQGLKLRAQDLGVSL